MASRLQSYISRQIGSPDELSKILSEKFLNNEARSVFVVGLPRSGKWELAKALAEKLKKAFKIILLNSEKDCASTFRTLLEKLEEAEIKVDKERINRGFEFDPSPNDDAKVSVYQGALKATLEKFSKGKQKLLVVIQGAEKIGSSIENEVFYDPPGNVAWMLISSSPIKSVISERGGSSYVAKNFGDKNTFYLKPFHGMPIESYCKQRNMEELQVWDELRNFLSELSAFARDGGQPSNFLEALRMKIVDNESIPYWIDDALKKYGCFELFNNDMGREKLLSVRTPKESCGELDECASATEWLKKMKKVGRFTIKYCDKEGEFELTDTNIRKYQSPHYRLKESLREGRRINVVASLLQDYFRSLKGGALEADWHCPPAGARWNEVFNDHGDYARFNRVELETKSGKNTPDRRVRSKPDVDKWI